MWIVGHIHSVFPTHDSDAVANLVEEDEETAFRAVYDEDWGFC
jgi:hypothetical protein